MEELWNGGGESEGGGLFGVEVRGGIFGGGAVSLEYFIKWWNLFSEFIWNFFHILNQLPKNFKEENTFFEKEWKNYEEEQKQ